MNATYDAAAGTITRRPSFNVLCVTDSSSYVSWQSDKSLPELVAEINERQDEARRGVCLRPILVRVFISDTENAHQLEIWPEAAGFPTPALPAAWEPKVEVVK